MKTYKYLFLPLALIMMSCYIYKPYSEKVVEDSPNPSENFSTVKSLKNESSSEGAMNKTIKSTGVKNMSPKETEIQRQKEKKKEEHSKNNFTSADGTEKNTSVVEKESVNEPAGNQSDLIELGIKGKLEPNKYYKIDALGDQYKIQVDKWEGDTLVAHKIRKPEKQFKFHMRDIDNDTVLERRFSKPFSDLLTVGAYASGAAILLLLIL